MWATTAFAAAPRVLPPGKVPEDRRLGPLKDLDGYFPFAPPDTREAWNARAAQLRRQVLVATGLWPMPAATPAQPQVYGQVARDGFTVEKVTFESFPGLFVTGNLYRPVGRAGRLPGVLCPHGHTPDGRFADAGVESARKQISEGAERFENGARHIYQARCAQLARMGCVVFNYDMLGYADSKQISFELAHRFAKQRPEMDAPDGWGLFSTQAELRAQSVLGIQTYQSIRALDWLASLPDVDPARLGVTGESGGGTQTFILSAVDDRPRAVFPAVMVSTAMQGGCTCENCSLLRVETGNIELAALTAPRALGMVGADDWTKEIMTKGYPQLKQLYGLLGAPDNVMAKALVQFPHNYNYVSREVMYQWFNQHLQLGLPSPVIEEDFEPLSIAELSVWDADHPKPAGGDDFERGLLRQIDAASNLQLAALAPTDAQSLARYRAIVGGAVAAIVGQGLPESKLITQEMLDEQDRGTYLEIKSLLRQAGAERELPVVFLHPHQWNGRVLIWLHGQGKNGLFDAEGRPIAEVARLLAAGVSVIAPDLLDQGEFLADGQPLTEAPRVANPREFAGYTWGYNPTVCAERARDVLAIAAFAHDFQPYHPQRVDLLANDGAAPWAAAAWALSAGAIDHAAIDTGGFRFAQLHSIFDLNFMPAIVKYGDLPALLSLGAPGHLWLAGEGGQPQPTVEATYRTAGQGGVTWFDGPAVERPAAAIDWLLR